MKILCNLRMFIAIYFGRRGSSFFMYISIFIDLTKLSTAPIRGRITGRLVSNELDRKWKETHMDYLEAFFWNFPAGTDENHEVFN